MITVYTALEMTKETTSKKVVMEMEADDAYALATVLMNLDDEIVMISAEWNATFRRLAHKVIGEANKCR
jgi:hypothetical protein